MAVMTFGILFLVKITYSMKQIKTNAKIKAQAQRMTYKNVRMTSNRHLQGSEVGHAAFHS